MEDLSKQGWYISNDGFHIVSANGTINDGKSLHANALNIDIKEFGESILSSELKKNVTQKVILQIQKIRNISAPKAKEDSQAAPRMLKLILTDGHTTCQAVEVNIVSSISRSDTPPGSKILINNCQIVSGFLILKPSNCTLLGGQVPGLWEKWELTKNMSNYIRNLSGGTDGAPPWVNFGEKIVGHQNSSLPFKALQEKTVKETDNSDKFNCQRQGAIAVASTGAVKKIFGGGVNTKIAHAYSDNQYNNRRNFGGQKNSGPYKGKREPREKVIDKPQKPADKVSLFDFLENKLSVNEDKSTLKNFQDNNNFKPKDTPKSFFKPSNNLTVLETVNNVIKPTSKNDVDLLASNLSKVSFNSQYASRSIKQHLNINNKSVEKSTNNGVDHSVNNWKWKTGDLCMAKYWEDGKYYNAIVIDFTEKTCVVQFNGYDNVEEVLKTDCLPIGDYGSSEMSSYQNEKQHRNSGYRNNRRQYVNNYRNYKRAS